MPNGDQISPQRAARAVIDTLDNLRAAVKLSFCRTAEAGRAGGFEIRFSQLVIGLLSLALLALVSAKLASGADSQFWIWGAMAWTARLAAWLSLLCLSIWLSRRSPDLLLLLIVSTYTLIPIAATKVVTVEIATSLGLTIAAESAAAVSTATAAWMCLVLCRAYDRILFARWSQTVAVGVIYFASLVAVAQLIPAPSPYYLAGSEIAGEQLDVESLYYRQPALLAEQVSALAEQNPKAIDLYAVTVAAFSAEDVFMREALGAAAVLERTVTAPGHALSLINNRQTQDDYPLANLPNLRQSLDRLGRVIDRDEDIVVVFLTSHGSQEARLSAEFGPVLPNDLSAASVLSALDDAGIRWRVIIISACFGGSFIPTLASPTTVVITAAAADRSSFGCRHENSWTYFGQAYFAEALPATASLIDAFTHALPLIARREERQGYESSEPQISVGRAIARQLDRFQQQARNNQSASSTDSR